MAQLQVLKALVNEDTFVAHDVSWATQTGKHLLRTQNVSDHRNIFCVPDTKFVSATNVARAGIMLIPNS